MSRIYIVTDRIAGSVTRYVRANNLNAAIRAVANETFLAAAASTEEIYQAVTRGEFDVLDAVASEQLDIDDKPEPAASVETVVTDAPPEFTSGRRKKNAEAA